MDPAERLKAWFKDCYERENFRCSFGETRIDIAGMNVLLGFLAQGISLAGYNDLRYRAQLIETHNTLTKMIVDLQKIPGHDATSQFHYPLILGVLIETALGAINQLKKEDRRL